jgi:predicted transposase YdaD
MRRDTIFHELFQQSSTLIFDFIQSPPEDAARYQFKSVEVKEFSQANTTERYYAGISSLSGYFG